MIPVLYKQDEKQFNHLGLGALSEAITCVATEERNGLFELELTYPINGSLYQEIIPERIIVADASPLLANQRFVIHRITKPKNGIVKVYAEHVSQYRTKNNSIKAKVSFSGNAQAALRTWNENLLYDSGFTVSSDIGTESQGQWTIDKVTDARKALGGVQGSILDRYGGEYLFDNDHISLLKQRGITSDVRIAYGKNLVDITQEEEITNTVTSIQPFALIFRKEGTEDDILTLPEDVIHSENIENFAHPKIKVHNFSGEEITTVEQLRARTNRFIAENQIGTPKVNLKIDFIDLSKTVEYEEIAEYENLNLCDEVLVDYPELGIEGVKGKVVKTIYNALLDTYDRIEVGDTRYTYSNSLSTITDKIEETEALSRAWLDDLRSSIINDYFNRDSYNYDLKVGNVYGLPSGYYSFDAPIEQNPTRVIYIGGGIMAIANSKTTDGAWNWRTIATGDGFIADEMFAGYISADLIRGGMQEALSGDTYINWNTGDFNIMSKNRRLRLVNGTLIVSDRPTSPSGTNNEIFSIQTGHAGDYTAQLAKLVKAHTAESIAISTQTANNTLQDYITCSGVGESRKVELRGSSYLYKGLTVLEGSTVFGGLTVFDGLKVAEIYSESGQKRIHLQDSGSVVTLDGNTQVLGDFGVSGAKNAIVETENFGNRAVSAYETAEYYFGDIGSNKLKDGKCKIEIEEIFAETVNTNIEYQVFLQAYGNANIWVSERHQDYFIVEGTDDIEFGWELKAKRKGYEYTRLEEHEVQTMEELEATAAAEEEGGDNA